jgi:peptidoglycan hydrolase-like protein with peptidoglycan-binding domain
VPPLPPAPPAFPGTLAVDPENDRPPVRTYQSRLVVLGYMEPKDVDGRYGKFSTAMTTRFQQDMGLTETGEVDQLTWEAAFPLQPPPPPPAGPGELVLALSTTAAVDPASIGALALGFGGVTLRMSATAVLEKVHRLAATTTEGASIHVRSFQLAHPENLPPDLGGLYGLEVQIKRGDRQPVTAYLTTEEPDKTVMLTLLINDLVAGVDPQQPTFDWRRRNMTAAGAGEFAAWETVTGRELFVTPVVAGV